MNKTIIKGKSINEILTVQKYDLLPKKTNVPYDLSNFIIDTNNKKLTFWGIKFLMLLLVNLEKRQIKNKDKKQLEIFDKDWDIYNDKNEFAVKIYFKLSDFLPNGYKNYENLRGGIKNLMEIVYDHRKGSLKNPPDKLTNLIYHFERDEKEKSFYLLIDKYWYRMLINGTYTNPFITSFIKKVDNLNTLLFYNWIKTFPKINNDSIKIFTPYKEELKLTPYVKKGIRKNYNDFLTIFDLNGKHVSQVKRDFLDIIRNNLNKIGDISFNYLIIKKNIYVVTYQINSFLINDNFVNPDLLKIQSSINNKIVKYGLNTIQSHMVLELYLKYTYDFIQKATSRKRKLTVLYGSDYYDEFLKLITEFDSKERIYKSYTQEDKISVRKSISEKLSLSV
ncbi:hypothetical protein [Flavobacterium psychrophilum]|uniref:hypothetical protein n=1 Tax=Flavobacterium psychrophilum TaxID=96345 RepID=UPI001069E32D|nr:hypothetical protein [Flavobacterium psychrophilum]